MREMASEIIQQAVRERRRRQIEAPPGCAMWLSWLPGEKRSWYRVLRACTVTAGRYDLEGAGGEVVGSLQSGDMIAVIRADAATQRVHNDDGWVQLRDEQVRDSLSFLNCCCRASACFQNKESDYACVYVCVWR